ncbi:outer membrane beta-barrel domain-containing protein [bacterium]|nr:outer membrane beta-barrel domain-containing protein [bacterium]
MKKTVFFLLLVLVSPIFGSSLDSEVDKYWGARRQIVVIQQKEFTKNAKTELTLLGGIVPNDAFNTPYPIGLKAEYYMSEFFALTLNLSYMINSDTGVTHTIEELGPGLRYIEKPNYQAMFGASYSFLYGKVAFGKTTLTYFDSYAFMELGVVGATYTKNSAANEANHFAPAASLGLGFRFYLSQNISFRFQVKEGFFMRASTSDGGEGGIQKPFEIALGVGMLF